MAAALVTTAAGPAAAQCGRSSQTVSLHATLVPGKSDQAPGTFLCRDKGPSGYLLEAFSDRSETPQQRSFGTLTVHYRLSQGKQVLKTFTLSSAVDPEVLWSESGAWLSVTGAPGASGPFIPRFFRLSKTGVQFSDSLRPALQQFSSTFPLCLESGKDKFCDQPEQHAELVRTMPDWLDIWTLAFDEHARTVSVLVHVPGSPRYGANVGQSWVYVVSLDDGHVVGKFTGKDAEARFSRDLRNAKAFMEPE